MSLMHRLDKERRRGINVVWLAFLVTMLVTGIDQAVKLLILIALGRGYSVLVLAPGLDLVVIWNSGISYGLLRSSWLFSWFLLLLKSLGIGFFVFAALGSSRRITGVALGLVVGGLFSNMIDRVRFGAVLEYLQPEVMGMAFFAINLADLALGFGFFVLAIDQFFVAGTIYVPAASRVAGSARPWFQR